MHYGLLIPVCLILSVFHQGVICFQCDFVDETVPVEQPDGTFRCVCDRSKGYIGPFEYACVLVECPDNMEPDDNGICQCKDEFFLNDNLCTKKSRCKPDEITVNNGSRFNDRKCLKRNTPISLRDPPLAKIEDIKSTSVRIQVFRNENETGQYNVTLTVSDGDAYQRVITDIIGETRMSVNITITELEANTSYRVKVTSSNEVGTSDPTILPLQTLVPAAAPVVTVRDVNQTTCTLEITPDKKIDNSGKISLTFRNLTDNTEGYLKKKIERDKKTTVINLNGLVANTVYQVQVKTDDIAGFSDSSQVMIQTKAEVVENIRAEDHTLIVIIVISIISAIIFMVVAVVIKVKCSRSGNRGNNVDAVEATDRGLSDMPTMNLVQGVLEEDTAVEETVPLKQNEYSRSGNRGNNVDAVEVLEEDTAVEETVPLKQNECQYICHPEDDCKKSQIVLS